MPNDDDCFGRSCDPEKLSTKSQKEFEAFEKLSKLKPDELNTLEAGLDDAIMHFKFKTGKVLN